MHSTRLRSQAVLVAVIAVLALLLSPAAFARGNVGVSIGFSGPGYSIGFSDYGRGHRGWSGAAYGGYGYGHGYGYGGHYSPTYYAPTYYAPVYARHAYPIVDRGYYYDYPRHSRGHYRHDRPIKRRVVQREVRYYDDHHGRGHDGYRNDSYRNDRDYQRRDESYGRASYYDRGY